MQPSAGDQAACTPGCGAVGEDVQPAQRACRVSCRVCRVCRASLLTLERGDDPHLAPLNSSYLSSFLQNALRSNQVEINTDSRTLRPIAKLREPRDPLAILREAASDGPPAGPRWPAECQVLEERVTHCEIPPQAPEAYYVPTGREVQPQPIGEEVGQVVFQYYPVSAVNYFSRSSVGGSRILTPASPPDLRPDDLRFESRFESGNLAKVVRITETYYELYLRTDLYTNRHMQWFYFRVQNMRRRALYRFSIVNLSKAESLYSCGMRPLLYSERDAQLSRAGWRRCGDNIAYFRNEEATPNEEQAPSYTLSFNIDFPHDNDTCYLAHCYPYTYSDLQDYLLRLQNHPVKSTFSKLRLLCRSLAGNNVYYLTITTPPPPSNTNHINSGNSNCTNNCTAIANNTVNSSNNNNNVVNNLQGSPSRCAACALSQPPPPPSEEPKKKKAVVLTARVHPGETPSSWMMKGFMDFLTGNSNQAKELRDKFIFKLVPMLNPDGVIVGNNRCSLTGRDLNRQYRTVIRETYPPVWHTKLMIRRLMEECGVVMYCDLHAHSRKHNVFIYGCENKRGPDKQLQEQVFPLMLHKNAADKFSFENCKFRIQRSKEGTGRVVVWMMGVANSYTMEASFGGSTLGSRNSTHFSAQDFENMGRAFCETLLDFCDQDPSKERLRNKIVSRLVKEGSSADEPTNIMLSDYSSDEGDTSSCSEDEANMAESSGSAPSHAVGVSLCPGVCQGLCACEGCPPPPASPRLPRRKQPPDVGTGSPKMSHRSDRTPPMPRSRQTLQVHTTLLDLPTSNGNASDAGDANTTPERQSSTETSPCRQQPQRPRQCVSPDDPTARISERADMPPELIVTPAHRRKGRGRQGSARNAREASHTANQPDQASNPTAGGPSGGPSGAPRRKSLSILVDTGSASRAGPAAPVPQRPSSQNGRGLSRRRHGSGRRQQAQQAKRATTPVPDEPPAPLAALEPGRVWLGTTCDQCDLDYGLHSCNNYMSNVPLAWGPPQHEQQREVLRSCSKKLSALSALQRHSEGAVTEVGMTMSIRVTRRPRSTAAPASTPGAAAPQQQAGTAQPRKSQSWMHRQGGRPSGGSFGRGSFSDSRAATKHVAGVGGAEATENDGQLEEEIPDGSKRHWRRGHLRLRRQKRHEVATATRIVEEAVNVLSASQRRRARNKSRTGAEMQPLPSPQPVPEPLDVEALTRRARFRRGGTLSNPTDLRSDDCAQESALTLEDHTLDSDLVKVAAKKKKKHKIGLPKRVKRVLSATAAISSKTSDKPR